MASDWAVPLAEALKLPLPEGRLSALAFAHGSLEVRLFAPRGQDTQIPHDRDEVYIVARGTGRLVRDGERVEVSPGMMLFVPAGMDHRFEGFSDDFATWVVFYGPEGGE
jgi:mannose-6-phosphate isomerase-like protein (cupin superfamily)